MRLCYLLLFAMMLLTACNDHDEQEKEISTSTPSVFPKSQISTYIRCIYQDRKGNLWMGTTQDGVCRFDPSAGLRTGSGTLTYFGKKQGFAGVCVKAIAEDKTGNLWFATEGGVSRYDGSNFTNFTVKDGLANNDTWSILIDRDGIIWVGTATGISRYDPSAGGSIGSKIFNDFPFPVSTTNIERSSSFNPNQVLDICEDRSGDVWIATGGLGVIKYHPSAAAGKGSATFTTYTTKEGLADNKVWCIAEDRAGNLWLGTRGGGVSRYNPLATAGTASFTNFSQKDGLPGNNVSAIVEDQAGHIWIGTSGGGISRYDLSSGSFTTITEREGITDNQVQSIYEDRAGNIWIGFSGGLFRFDGKSLINVAKDGPWQ